MKTNLEKLMLTKMYLDELYGLDEKYLAKIDQLEKQQTKFECLVSELKKPNHLFTRSSLAKVANESESLLFSIELELKDALITYYSTILKYIDSLIARIKKRGGELEQAEVKSNIEYSNGLTDSREDDYNNTIIVC